MMMIFNFVMFRVAATLGAIFLFVKLLSSTDFGDTTIGGIIAAFAIPLIALYAINTYGRDTEPKTINYKKKKKKRKKRRK